jgi:membrane protein implicated in regulation of membrane protease activity
VSPSLPAQVLSVATLVVALIGVLDALATRAWDLAAVLGLVVVLQLAVLSRARGRRRAVPVRDDLVRWLRSRSALSGEPVEVVADRAIASYRAQYGDEVDGARPSPREPVP